MLGVDVDPGIGAEISDYFSFYVPGYKFMPAYKNKVWDGKIRLFNRMTGELNAGLFVYLHKFCTERGYELDVQESDYGLPGTVEPVQEWDAWIRASGLVFEPYDYQINAVKTALERQRAILLSPTGSGKSYIIYLAIKYWISMIPEGEHKKVLVIVPTTSLVEQLYNDFKDYGMLVENAVHRIYSGKDKNTDKKVIISTWQSIYKNPRKWFEQFGMIVGDECHGFKSKSLSSIMNKATEAKYKIGCTGTLDGTQTHKLVLEGLFGPVYQVTTTKSLQDDKTLAALNISVLALKYSEETRHKAKDYTYQAEIDFLISHEKRNNFIRNLALDQKGNTLVLFQRVANHGKILFDLIDKGAAENRKVFFVSGQTETSDREAIRKIVEKQKDAIIVASLGTFSTGINIRNLHNIIFASPSKSQIKVLQSIGRGLRQSDDGRVTQLFDIADDLRYKRHINYTLSHSAERIKIYEQEQFNFKRYEIGLEHGHSL
jgi:superfamily II DNA or RNA helicase